MSFERLVTYEQLHGLKERSRLVGANV